MTQEEKELLIKDLCARLLYGFTIYRLSDNANLKFNDIDDFAHFLEYSDGEEFKPYLRPMSSMIDEEILELYKIAYTTWYSDSLYYKYEEWITFIDSIKNNALCFKSSIWLSDVNKVIDWLNSHHFDYRGLIEKGLALEAPENLYKN